MDKYHLPASHVRERIRQLRAHRIHAGEVPDLLRRHRRGDIHRGDIRATERLIEGFEFLVWKQYRWLEHHRNLWLRDRADEVLGQIYLDLCEAIGWLKTNEVPPSGVKGYIMAHLFHSHRHDYRNIVAEDVRPGENVLDILMNDTAMEEFRLRRKENEMFDDLNPETPCDEGLVEALRTIASGTRKLADCLELRGLRHDVIRKRVFRPRKQA
jgi:hypothetical protein